MVEIACEHAISILKKYYHFSFIPPIKSFILPPADEDSKVLFQEVRNEVYLGIQFEKFIFNESKLSLNYNKHISLNAVAQISEEISHFLMIYEAIQKKSRVSVFNLEIIGEIDRFLCLMHWNQFSSSLNILHKWKNIHHICDYVFQGNRFKSSNELYIQVENFAFKHLKNAFKKEWNATYFDFSNTSKFAAMYFNQLRNKFFYVR